MGWARHLAGIPMKIWQSAPDGALGDLQMRCIPPVGQRIARRRRNACQGLQEAPRAGIEQIEMQPYGPAIARPTLPGFDLHGVERRGRFQVLGPEQAMAGW